MGNLILSMYGSNRWENCPGRVLDATGDGAYEIISTPQQHTPSNSMWGISYSLCTVAIGGKTVLVVYLMLRVMAPMRSFRRLSNIHHLIVCGESHTLYVCVCVPWLMRCPCWMGKPFFWSIGLLRSLLSSSSLFLFFGLFVLHNNVNEKGNVNALATPS